MTNSQRSALIGMATAVLACSCAPADVRFRAESLLLRLSGGAFFMGLRA